MSNIGPCVTSCKFMHVSELYLFEISLFNHFTFQVFVKYLVCHYRESLFSVGLHYYFKIKYVLVFTTTSSQTWVTNPRSLPVPSALQSADFLCLGAGRCVVYIPSSSHRLCNVFWRRGVTSIGLVRCVTTSSLASSLMNSHPALVTPLM